MENKIIPTAEECFNNFVDFEICPLKGYTSKQLTNDTKLAMIEFAKLHVESALREASDKVTCSEEYQYDEYDNAILIAKINRDSILNSYPLENIK